MRHPHSLEALRDWLRTMPPEQEYDYANGAACMGAQYFRALGMRDVYVTAFNFRADGFYRHLPDGFDWVTLPSSREASSTFGAALARCNELLAQRPVQPFQQRTKESSNA